MAACAQCSTVLPPGARFCPNCGAIQSSVSQMPTAVASPSPPYVSAGPTSPIGRLESSGSFSGASFHAGQVLNGRYRVIGLLGRGGMGEVYRADDLELVQPVSLKFLGRGFAERPDMLDRFRGEVRNARQVSHANVCRVYDIGEAEGQYFISMEFVDGEDLGTLLRRIGRLPRAKADEVARQLCAGLASAHERGVIHRDLKPSNVMIDGEGRVRITDFGLAVRGENAGEGDVVGTPAYMAPEQFEGRPATPQTDLYSLGLILYEIYTGRRPLDANTWDGWKSQHSQFEPRSPQEVERDVEEPVARAILRCLEKDPSRRPRSAVSLAASLPGGDPLAAALAAGETPSPELIAASGGEGSLAPRKAWSLLGAVALTLVLILAVSPAATDLGLARLERGPAVLEARARDIVTALGYSQPPRDTETWLERDYDPMKWRADREPSTHWRSDYAANGPPLLLVHRQSPQPMNPRGGFEVGKEDPPWSASGMVGLAVDARGRLRRFIAVPPQVDSSGPTESRVSAATLFALAELDTARFEEVTPVWVPLHAFDHRREWVGTSARFPGASLRVSAAWWRAHPVAFDVTGPWTRVAPEKPLSGPSGAPFANFGLLVLIIIMLTFGAATLQRRLAGGQSDWRGGLRVAGFVVACRTLHWLLGAHHTLRLADEFTQFGRMMGNALLSALFLFSVYLAVEPFVRRVTPGLLIGWARVLRGRWSDPRVGRDALVGALFGTLLVLILWLVNAAPAWMPFTGQTPVQTDMHGIFGGRRFAALLIVLPAEILLASFTLFGGWFLLRLGLRRDALAGVALAALMTVLSLGRENPTIEVPGALLTGVLSAWLITRHGLLALLVANLVVALLRLMPSPLDMGASYAAQSVLVLAVMALLVGIAFRVSLGARSVLPSGSAG